MIAAEIKEDLKRIKTDAVSLVDFPLGLDKKRLSLFLSLLVLVICCFFADVPLRTGIKALHNQFFDWLFSFMDAYGKPKLTIFAFLALYFGGLLLKKGRIRSIGLRILEAFAFSGITVTAIKFLLGRWRPYTGRGNLSFMFLTIKNNDHLSMPSGDVAIAFALSSVIASLYKNKLWKIFWYTIASVTAIGRIYHDQHWLSDTVLAAIISIMVVFVVNRNYPKDSCDILGNCFCK